MHTHESRIRVRYAETDQMGVVYYANYLVWMEVGRVEYCRSLGINYHELEIDAGVFLAVAEANCRYHYPARYDQEVVVKTWIAASHPRMVEFRYELRLADSGRVTSTAQEPRDSSKARRRFSSIIGPRMNPSSSGAGSHPSLMNR